MAVNKTLPCSLTFNSQGYLQHIRRGTMSSTKRSISPQLVAQTSNYHSSVTLFELEIPRRSKRIKVETTTDDIEDIVKSKPKRVVKRESSSSPKEIIAKSPKKLKSIQQALKDPHPAPVKWEETYQAIKQMRSRIVAPVDTMGCDQAKLKESDPKNGRFCTLVSLMLSSQTKDEVTDAAVDKLRVAVGGSISVNAVIEANESVISDAIAKVGFWRRKTGYIKQTAQRLRDDFDSDVPKTVDELCSLPGVGPKMAFLALRAAWNLNHGIGVDVHVHRITNRLGWHKPPTKNPEETRLNLQSWLPKEYHGEINHMLVGFGQVICLPVGPRCDHCSLSTSRLCPSAQKVVNAKTRKAVVLSGLPKIEVELEEAKFTIPPEDKSNA